jgi:hypothetical protein
VPTDQSDTPFAISEFQQMDDAEGDPRWVDDIKKDLSRQFPEHEMFARTGPYGRMGYVLRCSYERVFALSDKQICSGC